MIKEVEYFKELMSRNFEIDDYQAIEIVAAAAVSHKIGQNEMLWLRIIGASGTGKTEILRTLMGQDDYCTTMESITPSAIRGGYVPKKKPERTRQMLLERIDGKLVITKEFATMLTKDRDAQREVFGLLRAVHDGEIDADYGSEQGYFHQHTRFDWILGTTQFVERQRQLEVLLGSRFIDLKWGRPIQKDIAVNKAYENDGNLIGIRKDLKDAMTNIISNAVIPVKPQIEYLAPMANLAAMLRTPIERDGHNEVIDLPDVELGTRYGQSLGRICRGLLMLGVPMPEVKPYIIRLVMDSMTRARAGVIKAWLDGETTQTAIAARMDVSQGFVNRIIEDLQILKWNDKMLRLLRVDNGSKPQY
jgi:hypothetical protein